MAEWTEQLAHIMRESVNASMEGAVRFQEQTWRMVDDLIQRGAIAKEEGKQLLDTWTRRTEEFQERMEEKYRQCEEGLKAGLRDYLPPTRKDLEDLHRKLDQLMVNLQMLTGKRPRAPGTGRRVRKTSAKARRKRR